MTNIYPQLHDFLSFESQLCDQIIDLLQREHDILIARNLDDLSEVTKLKQEKLKSLEQTSSQREALVKQFASKGATQKQTMAFIISGANGDYRDKLQSVWTKLKDNLARCKRMNEVNGRIINRSKQAIEKMLVSLRVNQGQTTYDRSGKASAYRSDGASVKV